MNGIPRVLATGALVVGSAGLFLGATATHVVEGDGPRLAGHYACEGTNPQGGAYRSILEVLETGQTWHLRWSFPDSDGVVFGVGVRQDDRLVIGIAADGILGVVTYTVKNGTWEGRWPLAGLFEVYPERCVKIAAGAPNRELQEP